MQAINGFNNVQAMTGEYERIPAGGYVATIKKVDDVPDKQYLKIYFDISEGDYSGWFATQYRADTRDNKTWKGNFIRSYKTSALGFFKGFLTVVDRANNTAFSAKVETGFDEKELVGRQIGVVLCYEEREYDGKIIQVMRVERVKEPDKIRDGDYTVPELKKLETSVAAAAPVDYTNFASVSDDDLPW